MKSMKCPLPLVVTGLVVGLMALWASAPPVGTSGDLFSGGWYLVPANSPYWGRDSLNYSYCTTPTLASCADGLYWNKDQSQWKEAYCQGVTILIEVVGATGSTPILGSRACSGGMFNFCNSLHDVTGCD